MTDPAIDDGTEAMMEMRRSTGKRMLFGALAVGGPAIWWIRNGLREDGDPAMIWGPGGIALVIAAAIAIAAIVHLAKRPTV